MPAGLSYKGKIVFLYETTLVTKSPILKTIYCEGHRLEPWAIKGGSYRYGYYPFPNVLYIDHKQRQQLLDELRTNLNSSPNFYYELYQRFYKAGSSLIRLLNQTITPNARQVAELCHLCSKLLSAGIFKEILEHDGSLSLLGNFIPVKQIKPFLADLYQPHCLPHYLNYKYKLYYWAERYCANPTPSTVQKCCDQCAHLSAFLLEDSPLHDPQTMLKELIAILNEHDNDPSKLKEARQMILKTHRQAVKRSHQAAAMLLDTMNKTGSYQLHSHLVVTSCVHFIQFTATMEELKHTLVMKACRRLNLLMKSLKLPPETCDLRTLLTACC